MTKLTSSEQEAARVRGFNALFAIAGGLNPGRHLLTSRVVLESGKELPARVLVTVAAGEGEGGDDVISMEPSQVSTFALILGAGLVCPQTAHCNIVARSTAPGTIPAEQAWEMTPALTPDRRGLRPLSAFEASHRHGREQADAAALTFRDAFELPTLATA
ncbi:hypothetical protein [Streptomyces sp. NPDC051098]|uniref:hypothetical protein n=1 Tax=Streptomyces sp. NPDC051098 TaxID=3155411 RepID=UPI0034350020